MKVSIYFFFFGLVQNLLVAASFPDFVEDGIFVYAPSEASAAAADASGGAACGERYDDIIDFCDGRSTDIEFGWSCEILYKIDFLENLGGPSEYTIFLPTNKAVDTFFTQILQSNEAQKSLLRDIFSSHILFEKRESNELECKSKPDALGPNPALSCKTDIAGNPISYVKGKFNKKVYLPRFLDPASPIGTCNSNLFPINNVILATKPP